MITPNFNSQGKKDLENTQDLAIPWIVSPDLCLKTKFPNMVFEQ